MTCKAEANRANSVKRLLLTVAVVCGLAAFGRRAETVVANTCPGCALLRQVADHRLNF